MASFWDLFPASSWSARPSFSSFEPTQMLAHAAGARGCQSTSQFVRRPVKSRAGHIRQSAADDRSVCGRYKLRRHTGRLFGSKADSASPPDSAPGGGYGVIPKNLPPDLRPPPISGWQKPEAEFGVTPSALARFNDALAAGQRPDAALISSPAARMVRDNARIADLLIPGSGNFVSGDWNNVTPGDFAKLAVGLASAFVPPARGTRAAGATIRAARAASEAEAAAAGTRAATTLGISARAGAPAAGTLNSSGLPPPILQLTGQYHHAISKKVHNALEKTSTLRGLYQHRDPRFITQAIDKAAHRGYQTWHRDLDSEVAGHIRDNPEMTPEEFEQYLRDRYNGQDLLGRFPNGL